jgi:putative phosphoribosyl transferase
MFRNRRDAGVRLAELLGDYTRQDAIIYGLVRGGVPVAYEIALRLEKPLEAFIVRKIGLPGEEELALGAVAEGREFSLYLNDGLMKRTGYNKDDLKPLIESKLAEIHKMQLFYRAGENMLLKPSATAILVDDGVATGATLKAAILSLRTMGQGRIVVASPAGQTSILEEIHATVEDVICAQPVQYMEAVGEFYYDFREISHDDVRSLIYKAKHSLKGTMGNRPNKR